MQHAGSIGMAGDDPRWRTSRGVHAASLSGTSSITVSRMLWARALPGTVAVVAALTLPGFSPGAGDIDDQQSVHRRAREPAPQYDRTAVLPTSWAPAMAPDGHPPEGLRTLLAPVLVSDAVAVAAGAPVVAAGAFVPEPRREGRPTLAADGVATARSSASQPLSGGSPALVAENASLPHTTAAPAALTRPAAIAEVAIVMTGPAPEAGPLSQPAGLSQASESVASASASASGPQTMGGRSAPFVSLAPPAMGAPNAALMPDYAMIGEISVPTGARDAAPGRRPALEEIAAVSAGAVSTPEAPALASTVRPAGLEARPQVAAHASASAYSAASSAVVASPALAVPAPPAAGRAAPASAAETHAIAAPRAPVAAVQTALAAPAPKSALAPAARAPLAVDPSAAVRAAPPASPAPLRPSTQAPAPTPARPASANAAALAPLPIAKSQQAAPGLGKSDGFQIDILSQLTTRVDGKAAGKVDFRQTSSGLQVRLGSIVELLGDRYDAAEIARIRASSAGNLYLPLAQLQAQGIPISYDPVYDEFNVGMVDTRPKAARKVHMDQISTPERGIGSTGVDQVRR